MIKANLSTQIRVFRTSKKMTLAALAERLGVTTSAVAAYENGTRNPSFDVLIKMARIFNVTVDNLFRSGNKDLVDISYLTINQREDIIKIIKTYQMFNFALMEMFQVTGNKLPEDIELCINSDDLERFKEFIKKKNKENNYGKQ